MEIGLEQMRLAEELNKLYAYVKAGGDFSFDSEGEEIRKAKDFVMQNYANMQTGILSFLTNIVNNYPDCEFVFEPSKNGVYLNYSYRVMEKVEFDKNGLFVKQSKAVQNSSLNEMINS